MKRQKEQSLWLRAPEGRQDLPAPLLAIVCAAALYTLSGMTGLESPVPLILSGAAVCIGYGSLRRNGWFWPALLGLMLVLTGFFHGAAANGLYRFFNGIGDIYTAKTGIVIPALEVTEGDPVLFPVLLGMAFGAVCCALSRAGGPVLGAVLAAGYALAAGLLRHAGDPLPLTAGCALLLFPRRKKAIAPIALLCVLAALSQTQVVSQWSRGLSEAILQEYHRSHYETDQTTLPEGRISEAWTASPDAPALVVTLEKPEQLYLRGFTGAVLEGGRWSPLDCGTLQEESELLYWLNLHEFDLRTQFEAAASGTAAEKNTVTVQNIGACSAYRYVPFSLCADDSLSPEELSPDILDGKGERYDVFTTVYRGAALLPEVLASLEEDSPYRRAESAYREFAEQYYLQIPADAQALLLPYWEDLDSTNVSGSIGRVLEQCLPDASKNSPRAVTVTVLTLRWLGIPARYAEGYIIPESAEATIQVTASCAACWAEVYQDGAGWVPMALTPGVSEQTTDRTEAPPPDEPETPPLETRPQEQEDPTGGTQLRLAPVLWGSLLVFLASILILLLLILVRRALILRRRRRLFASSDAVPLILTDAVLLLERKGIRRGTGSLYAMIGTIRDRFGSAYAELFRLAADRNAAALFSSRKLTEEDLAAMLEFRLATLELLTADAPWYKRLWMRYILCLF